MKIFQHQILTVVKNSKKHFPSKAYFTNFLQLSCSHFKLNLCERSYNYQNCQKKIKFEGAWGKLQAKSYFSRQSFTKYLRQTLAFL